MLLFFMMFYTFFLFAMEKQPIENVSLNNYEQLKQSMLKESTLIGALGLKRFEIYCNDFSNFISFQNPMGIQCYEYPLPFISNFLHTIMTNRELIKLYNPINACNLYDLIPHMTYYRHALNLITHADLPINFCTAQAMLNKLKTKKDHCDNLGNATQEVGYTLENYKKYIFDYSSEGIKIRKQYEEKFGISRKQMIEQVVLSQVIELDIDTFASIVNNFTKDTYEPMRQIIINNREEFLQSILKGDPEAILEKAQQPLSIQEVLQNIKPE